MFEMFGEVGTFWLGLRRNDHERRSASVRAIGLRGLKWQERSHSLLLAAPGSGERSYSSTTFATLETAWRNKEGGPVCGVCKRKATRASLGPVLMRVLAPGTGFAQTLREPFLYESAIAVLKFLTPLLSDGAVVIFDIGTASRRIPIWRATSLS